MQLIFLLSFTTYVHVQHKYLADEINPEILSQSLMSLVKLLLAFEVAVVFSVKLFNIIRLKAVTFSGANTGKNTLICAGISRKIFLFYKDTSTFKSMHM